MLSTKELRASFDHSVNDGLRLHGEPRVDRIARVLPSFPSSLCLRVFYEAGLVKRVRR